MGNTRNLEKRLYFFVPYNLSPIQQAIQAGHAALEYAHKFKDDEQFVDFVKNWKTWIILDGGTTNNKVDNELNHYKGTLNQLETEIIKFNFAHRNEENFEDIKSSHFHEPDLNNALTAVCFIADERVFNYDDYPDFSDWIMKQEIINEDEKLMAFTALKGKTQLELLELFPGMYPLWEIFLGGSKNVFLRNLLKGKRFA